MCSSQERLIDSPALPAASDSQQAEGSEIRGSGADKPGP